MISLLHTRRPPNSSLFSSTTSSTRVSYLTSKCWDLLIPSIAVHTAQPGWRRIIAQAVLWGIPTPAFSTALAFFDGYRSEIVPANLLQAQVCGTFALHDPWSDSMVLQRDYFGAHTFRVLPGKENDKFKTGEDIRKLQSVSFR